MKAEFIARAQNLFDTFIQHFHSGGAVPYDEFFAADARVEFPYYGIYAEGVENIPAAFDKFMRVSCYDRGFSDAWYYLQSPAFSVLANRFQAKMMWETAFHMIKDGDTAAEQGGGRFDVEFDNTDRCRITFLRFYESVTFLPTDCRPEDIRRYDRPADESLPPIGAEASAADVVGIQNAIAYFAQQNLQNIPELWAGDDDISLDIPSLLDTPVKGRAKVIRTFEELWAKQVSNRYDFLLIPLLSAPVVVSDGKSATGYWMSQNCHMENAAYGIEGDPLFIRTLGRWVCEFEKAEDRWLIRSIKEYPIIRIPAEVMGTSPKYFGQRDRTKNDRWMYPPVEKNYAEKYPAVVFEVQSMLPEWICSLRRAENRTFIRRFYSRAPEACFYIRDPVYGYENILPRVKQYEDNATPRHLRGVTSHNGSTPYVYVNETGTEAEIAWFDQSYTNKEVVEHEGMLNDSYFRLIAQYRWKFVLEEGEWRVNCLRWIDYAMLEFREANPKLTRGFAHADKPEKYPYPFEDLKI